MIGSCDRVTGNCDKGCKAGWSGIHCDQGKFNLLSMHDFDFETITIYFQGFMENEILVNI